MTPLPLNTVLLPQLPPTQHCRPARHFAAPSGRGWGWQSRACMQLAIGKQTSFLHLSSVRAFSKKLMCSEEAGSPLSCRNDLLSPQAQALHGAGRLHFVSDLSPPLNMEPEGQGQGTAGARRRSHATRPRPSTAAARARAPRLMAGGWAAPAGRQQWEASFILEGGWAAGRHLDLYAQFFYDQNQITHSYTSHEITNTWLSLPVPLLDERTVTSSTLRFL